MRSWLVARGASIVALACAVTACGPEFDRPSEIAGLRVLAVQKDKPYPAPGEEVTLTMLDHDRQGRSIQRTWLAACENPPADLYAGCFTQFQDPERLLSGLGTGPQFTFTVSPDIISRRPPPLDPEQPPYGLVYVFFAACAGELRPALGEAFPLGCFEGDERLGPNDFVVGYSSLFVYESFRNGNPIITGIRVQGTSVDPDCIGVDCVIAPPMVPGEEPRPELTEDCSLRNPRCIEICEEADDENCPDIAIQPIIPRSTAEPDEVLAALGESEPLEQMWVNYYVDRGSLSSEVRLLNDASRGFNEDYGTNYRAPRVPGPVNLWAVAHDNRGGAQWVRLSLFATRR